MPYTGEIKIDPKPLYPAEHLVVVLPKTMQFKAANASSFQIDAGPGQGDTTVEVAQQNETRPAAGLHAEGHGIISEAPDETASGAAQQQDQQARDKARQAAKDATIVPAGDSASPIDAPDALQKYRWPILGGFAVLLAIGGWVVTKRQPGPNLGCGAVCRRRASNRAGTGSAAARR